MTVAGLFADIRYLLPELFLIGTGFAIVLFDFLCRAKQRDLGIVSLCAFAIAAGLALYVNKLPFGGEIAGRELFFGMISNDEFSVSLRLLIYAVMFITVLLSMGERFSCAGDVTEYYALLIFQSVGLAGLVLSDNLLMVYLSLELISLSSYILASLTKRDFFSSEASLKYFLFGALSTGILLFGVSMVYGLTGSLDLDVIFAQATAGAVPQGVLYVAGVFLLAGLGFKIAMVPFHMWAPDVYQGAPTPITALLSVGPKIAAFAALLRIFDKGIGNFGLNWFDLVGVLAVLTMTAGNVIAISQNNVKRMLAYSSIAQAGYILIGFAVPTKIGETGVIVYLLAYAFMNLGAFAVVIAFINSLGSELITDFKGLSQKAPAACFVLTVFLLSLAGIPPTAGFLGKFYVFSAAIDAGKIYLAVAGVINSVIALYYYVRVVKCMYMDSAEREAVVVVHPALAAAMIISLAGTLAVGICPEPFINAAVSAVKIF
jgi:NADH-quinone oxidoreductase subunit N